MGRILASCLVTFIFGPLYAMCSDNRTYYIGAVFDNVDEDRELAFRFSIDRVKAAVHSYNLKFVPHYSEPNDPFGTTHSACSLFEKKIVAVFGPTTVKNGNTVHGVCDNKEIAFVETRWDFGQENGRSLINLHPYPPLISKALVEILDFLEWKDFTIFYKSVRDLAKFGDLLMRTNSTGPTVVVRQLDEDDSEDYRPVFKTALRLKETHFVIDCSIEKLDDVLRQAQQVGLITSGYNFLITNLDAQVLDLTPYQYGEATIIAISLVDVEQENVIAASEKLQELRLATENRSPTVSVLRTEIALTLDAMEILVRALDELKLNDIELVSCGDTASYGYGYSILNYMKSDTMEGVTGTVKFDHRGLRTDFDLNILKLKETGLTKIGTWSARESIRPRRISEPPYEEDVMNLRNMTFRVQTALTPPYAMLIKSTTQLSGNNQYEGFGIDLIHELSLMEGFSYVFSLREDKANGAKLKNGTWTGMIGDIIANKVDLAITDFTITAEREEAVEFTPPFMSLGVSILYRKPTKAPPSFFSFAAPFALEVWLLLAGATFGVSIALYVTGRLCPAEWSNPYPCVQEPRHLLNQFNLRNSVWFAVGSLMQQGSEIAPVGVSTRMVAGVWWFFTLIMVSCYTANLAASLTSESTEQHFANLKELVERADRIGIGYGAKQGGSTETFFMQGAKNKTEFKVVYEHMQSRKSEMVQDNTVGVTRAENGKYAFFMESTSIEYEIQRHCNLTQVGGKLDEKGYGIAMRKHSGYRHHLSTALLKLQSAGVIDQLKRKWWEEKGGQCSNEEPPEGAPPLDFKNVSGIFWVTIGGAASALLMVIVELILHTFKTSMRTKSSLKKQLKKEIDFYFKVGRSVKPVDRATPASSDKNQDVASKKDDNDATSYTVKYNEIS